MSGQKRSSLTWIGGTGLAGFALLLLPLLPVRGQQAKEPQNDVRWRVVLQGDDAKDQEAAELLRRVLKLLEQKRSETGEHAKPADRAEIRKAEETVEHLRGVVEVNRRHLQESQARLRAAEARLAQLQGKTLGLRLTLDAAGPLPKGPLNQLALDVGKNLVLIQDGKAVHNQNDKAIWLLSPKKGPASGDELRQRLDRLMREIEELRREIHRIPQDAPKKPAPRSNQP